MPYILTTDSGLRITDLNFCVQISTNDIRIFLDNNLPFEACYRYAPLVIQQHETAVILKNILEEHVDGVIISCVEDQIFNDFNIDTIPAHVENLILNQGKKKYATG